jgi:hypothetical protein
MTLLEEIQAKCNPALLASRDQDAIAAAVNVGRVKVVSKLGGIGTVLETLGPVDGASLLDQLEQMTTSNSAVKWAFVLVNRAELDFGSAATRAMIDLLIPGPAGEALKAVAVVPDPVTAQEINNAMRTDAGEWRI